MLASMKETVRKEILFDLQKAFQILEKREATDVEGLRILSDHAIEDVAAQKDLDLVAVTVLLYSFYKVAPGLGEREYGLLRKELQAALQDLGQGRYGKYNFHIKRLFELVRQCHGKVREHLQDVLHAARIKKGTLLLEKGLSMGQAAGLMGLSNWDLQGYAGKTNVFYQHKEAIPAKKRLQAAFRVFGVRP